MSGRASRDAGKQWEGRIENALTAARQARIVEWFDHQHDERTRFGKSIRASGADFVGFLAGSTNLAIECKSTQEHAGSTRIAKKWFTKTQQEHLDSAHRSGGLSLAAMEFREPSSGVLRGYLMPWSLVPWVKKVSAYTVGICDIDPRWRIPPEESILQHVRKCPTCFAWVPLVSGRRGCCGGAAL